MLSFLAVTEEASDLHLLTIAEMRVAAGLVSTDNSQDAALRARSLAVAAGIATECGIATGSGGFDPTLMQETLTETFYSTANPTWSDCATIASLQLARRHNVEIVSLSEDGTALVTTDYLVDPETGVMTRLVSEAPGSWSAQKLVVVYRAGFETVPADLKQAATDYFRAIGLEATRDPYVKAESVEIPGVESRRTELWTGNLPGTAALVPPSVAAQLTRFRIRHLAW
jgi:hypothetical protein